MTNQQPPARVKYWHGSYWREQPAPGDDWLDLGTAPKPKTRWQVFRYHVLHGLLMGYPLREVLAWSWRNRHSFEEELDG